MQMPILALFFFLFIIVQGLEPSPAPAPRAGLAPVLEFTPSPASLGEFGGSPESPSPGPVGDSVWGTVRWCAVREGFEDCQYIISRLHQSGSCKWKCVKKYSVQECLESVHKGEADIVNLEAGLAYTAFLNYSMKAIANEVYCNHRKSNIAVAVVNRKACETEGTSILDFKGQKSCHGGYSTAAGWNYPINHIKNLIQPDHMNDWEFATNFFSEVCAPSDFFEDSDTCAGCDNENGSCHSNRLYFGHAGAFRCLVEELGDISFVTEDTALLYSMEGPHNQSWSAKSVRDFMYLCPKGGCREINGYPGDCSFGTVPANVIMASNSITHEKKSLILLTLTNNTWIDTLYATEKGFHYLLSRSIQGFVEVKEVTRSYLGKSASISKSMQQELNLAESKATQNATISISNDSSCLPSLLVKTFLSVLAVLISTVFSAE